MNKEILEITKKFHDTYEKLASEYTYETREDTKVFDINSNNGKLMYATVNEIVSPILKENKILKENAENNDKVVDKVNWENQLLKKQLEYLRSGEYYNQLRFENEMLQQVVDTNGVPSGVYDYIDRTHRNTELLEQQKEFIKWLEDYLKLFDNMNIEEQVSYDMIEEILQKYRSIIGCDKVE